MTWEAKLKIRLASPEVYLFTLNTLFISLSCCLISLDAETKKKPLKPATPAKPVKPSKPVKPAKPMTPAKPVTSAKPVTTAKPGKFG